MSVEIKSLHTAALTTSPASFLGLDAGGLIGRVASERVFQTRTSVSDLNDAWGAVGIYYPTETCANYPAGVTVNTSDAIICTRVGPYGVQLLLSMISTNIYFRRRLSSTWSGWFKITGAQV